MGLLDRFFRRNAPTSPAAGAPIATVPLVARNAPIKKTVLNVDQDGLVKLSGTTTFAREAITALATRHGLGQNGYLEIAGTLQREVENAADPSAVAVHVQGERIGYLPGHLAATLRLSPKGAHPVAVQIFTELLPKGLRAEAWAWLGDRPAEWQWSETMRPPMTAGEKARSAHVNHTQIVKDALVEGGSRAEDIAAGMVNGVHYLELVEPIKQLKREQRLDEALTLCYAAITGAENASKGREPAPWYTEQAAIIHRKLGQPEKEVAVLKRWLEHCSPERRNGTRIGERLAKIAV